MTNLERSCNKLKLTSEMIMHSVNATLGDDDKLTAQNVDDMLSGGESLHAKVKAMLEAWNINQDIIENIA